LKQEWGELPAIWPASLQEKIRSAGPSPGPHDIRSLLSQVRRLPSSRKGSPFCLSIARTFTLETQLESLLLSLHTLPCQPDIRLGPLDNLEQTLLQGNSSLLRPPPDAVLVLWRLEELHPTLAFGADSMTVARRRFVGKELIQRIKSLAHGFTRASHVPLFLSTIPPLVGRTVVSSLEAEPESVTSLRARANEAIRDLCRQNKQIHLFDFAGWVESKGQQVLDMKMDLYARQPIGSRAWMSFGDALVRTLRPLRVPPAKALAVDLDNVIWGGVLGEVGESGIRLGKEFPGNVYFRIQQRLLELRSRGVLLAMVSKNNEREVCSLFRKRPDMPLQLRHFSSRRVNWAEKHANLEEISRELGLGLDSFAFLDDQAFERDQMRHYLPQVRVLPVQEDPLSIVEELHSTSIFNGLKVGKEDRLRAREYENSAKRKRLQKSSRSADEFLRSLKLTARVRPVTPETVGRAVQLLSKTNQFNISARRHDEAAVRAMLSRPKNSLLTLQVMDRFGDQGIVGLGIALALEKPSAYCIDTFLLSCRAIGRGAEDLLWHELMKDLHKKNGRRVRMEYLSTGRNSLVLEFLDRLNLKTKIKSAARRVYEAMLPFPGRPPAHIRKIP